MVDLIAQVPAAESYLVGEISMIQASNPGVFARLKQGVIATTSPDQAGEALTLAHLTEFAEHISKRGLWLIRNHDPLEPPVGRVMSARVFEEPKDGHHFVAAVIGLFAPNSFSSVQPYVEEARVDRPIPAAGPLIELRAQQASESLVELRYDPHSKIDGKQIEQFLADAPSGVARQPQQLSYKALDPLQILLISLPSVVLAKLIDCTVTDLYAWLKKVSIEFATSRVADHRISIQCWRRGCELQLVLHTAERQSIEQAFRKLPQAAALGAKLIDLLASEGVERVVIEFDAEAIEWKVVCAATRRLGVLTDGRALAGLDDLPSGLSIGAVSVRARK